MTNVIAQTYPPYPARTWHAGFFGPDGYKNTWSANYFSGAPVQALSWFDPAGTSWANIAVDITNRSAANLLTSTDDGSTINLFAVNLILAVGGSNNANQSAMSAASAGTDGAFTTGWTNIGLALKNAGLDHTSTILRMGWEMNQSVSAGNPNGWYPWATIAQNGYTLAQTQGYFKGAWIRAVNAVRANCSNVRFAMCYCCNQGGINECYPGASYVDVIAADFYDIPSPGFQSYAAFVSSQQHGGVACGMNELADLAQANGHKFMVTEWGTQYNDNPLMADFMFQQLNNISTTYPGILIGDTYCYQVGKDSDITQYPRFAAEYKKLWSNVSSGTITPPTTFTTPNSSYTVPNLSAGAHTLRVTAVNAQGESVFSAVDQVFVSAPSVAGSVQGAAIGALTSTTIPISWSGASGTESGFNLYLNSRLTTSVAAGGGTYTFTGLTAATAYTVAIAAFSTSGGAPVEGPTVTFTNVTTNTGVATQPPNAPVIGTATGGVASASVQFTPGTGAGTASSYSVYSGGVVVGSGSASPVAITNLSAGTYSFTVVGVNSQGSSAASAASNTVTVTAVASVPAAPTSVVGTGGYNSASVAFVASTGATSYTATLVPANNSHPTLTSSATASPVVFDGSLASHPAAIADTYTVTLVATNAAGASTAAAASPATITVNPMVVTGFAATAHTATTVTVTWTGCSGNPGQYNCLVNFGSQVVVHPADGLTHTFTGLTAGTQYSFEITPLSSGISGTQTKIYFTPS